MKKEVIQVNGMTCGHCKSAVEGALKSVDGVVSAEVNLEENNVTVQFEDSKVSLDKLKSEIDDQGYDVVS
ncbi:copper chaperone CopZ [Evansella cellulosilytica]|uniref:Copper chaperone CopZ n=1 Tax=Evansella cellulosilytica (strain ATCC 21833 / DSM 2522 / FERM P-1141 / JCM 9156 / N-4) TaxID=649639 RepID=E6TRZ0_EVAC2|nr:copper chaperone CopZ [Evansella cellulosilytica]ADU30644.1 Heavy metal transport/detoxification protein [Evansella cellulosilytica DSM 2522]